MKFDVKESIKQKNIIQKNSVKLLYTYRRILLSWATGCGKTLAALKMIKELSKFNPKLKGYIICKEFAHLDNWDKDIEKHGMSFINDISEKFLYHSLHKYNDKVDFLILDECHALTPLRIKKLSNILTPDTIIIMLSATVPYEKKMLINQVFNFHNYNISISEAIHKGIIPVPDVHIRYVQMTSKQRYDYKQITEDMEYMKDRFDETGRQNYYIKWLALGSKRKRLIAGFKTEFAKNLIKTKFQNSRFIVFTSSISQAEEIDPLNSVHSDLEKEFVVRKKNNFNSGKTDRLIVVNMFREAINLENVEKGMIVQLDNKKLSFIQMLGRVFRSKLPEMHILVVQDTQDEKYLKNVMKGFNMKYVNYHGRVKNNDYARREQISTSQQKLL